MQHIQYCDGVLLKGVRTERRERDSAVHQSPRPFPSLSSLFILGEPLLNLNWIPGYRFIQQVFIGYLLSALKQREEIKMESF